MDGVRRSKKRARSVSSRVSASTSQTIDHEGVFVSPLSRMSAAGARELDGRAGPSKKRAASHMTDEPVDDENLDSRSKNRKPRLGGYNLFVTPDEARPDPVPVEAQPAQVEQQDIVVLDAEGDDEIMEAQRQSNHPKRLLDECILIFPSNGSV